MHDIGDFNGLRPRNDQSIDAESELFWKVQERLLCFFGLVGGDFAILCLHVSVIRRSFSGRLTPTLFMAGVIDSSSTGAALAKCVASDEQTKIVCCWKLTAASEIQSI